MALGETWAGYRIGIMGGTFDPIHHGHLVAASQVQDVFDLDEVIFVPTSVQPFKSGRQVTSPEHRYLMTNVAVASNPHFSVSRVDIDRGGTTYTVDTLRDLAAQRPGAEFYFITGADALTQIMEWKDSDRLFEMANFVGVTRPGHCLRLGNLPSERVALLEITAMAISSTEIRARVKRQSPIWYLVPDGVVQYIGKYGLYREQATATLPTALSRVEDGVSDSATSRGGKESGQPQPPEKAAGLAPQKLVSQPMQPPARGGKA